MAVIELWPDGELSVGDRTVDGVTYVMLVMVDPATGTEVNIGYRLDHFVAVADHLQMCATALVNRER